MKRGHVYCEQALDFGLCLRLKNGALAIAMLPKVFRVLCALDPKGYQYQKPLLEQMLLLKYHEYQRTPTWKLLTKHFHLFNEEVGEISLSVLSRLQKPVLNKKPDVEHWDKQYRLSKQYQSIDDSVNNVNRDKNHTRSRPIKIKKHAETTAKTQVFLDGLVRSAGDGTFTMLTGPKKEWNSRRYRGDAWRREMAVGRRKAAPMFKRDITEILLKRWKLVEQDTGSRWAATHMAGSWPEFSQGLDVAQEDVEEQSEGGSPNEGDDLGEGDGEGDDNDGAFMLPGVGSESEESEIDAGEMDMQDYDRYMSEFVDVGEENAGRLGGEGSDSDEGAIEEAEEHNSEPSKGRKRQRVLV